MAGRRFAVTANLSDEDEPQVKRLRLGKPPVLKVVHGRIRRCVLAPISPGWSSKAQNSYFFARCICCVSRTSKTSSPGLRLHFPQGSDNAVELISLSFGSDSPVLSTSIDVDIGSRILRTLSSGLACIPPPMEATHGLNTNASNTTTRRHS